jgi:predicted methyltransferase
MARADNGKWIQDIRDEISEFEVIKNDNIDAYNHYKTWDYAVMAAELAEKRYASSLKKSIEAQNRIYDRNWLYDLDYFVRKYSNQALLDIFAR